VLINIAKRNPENIKTFLEDIGFTVRAYYININEVGSKLVKIKNKPQIWWQNIKQEAGIPESALECNMVIIYSEDMNVVPSSLSMTVPSITLFSMPPDPKQAKELLISAISQVLLSLGYIPSRKKAEIGKAAAMKDKRFKRLQEKVLDMNNILDYTTPQQLQDKFIKLIKGQKKIIVVDVREWNNPPMLPFFRIRSTTDYNAMSSVISNRAYLISQEDPLVDLPIFTRITEEEMSKEINKSLYVPLRRRDENVKLESISEAEQLEELIQGTEYYTAEAVHGISTRMNKLVLPTKLVASTPNYVSSIGEETLVGSDYIVHSDGGDTLDELTGFTAGEVLFTVSIDATAATEIGSATLDSNELLFDGIEEQKEQKKDTVKLKKTRTSAKINIERAQLDIGEEEEKETLIIKGKKKQEQVTEKQHASIKEEKTETTAESVAIPEIHKEKTQEKHDIKIEEAIEAASVDELRKQLGYLLQITSVITIDELFADIVPRQHLDVTKEAIYIYVYDDDNLNTIPQKFLTVSEQIALAVAVLDPRSSKFFNLAPVPKHMLSQRLRQMHTWNMPIVLLVSTDNQALMQSIYDDFGIKQRLSFANKSINEIYRGLRIVLSGDSNMCRAFGAPLTMELKDRFPLKVLATTNPPRRQWLLHHDAIIEVLNKNAGRINMARFSFMSNNKRAFGKASPQKIAEIITNAAIQDGIEEIKLVKK